MLSMSMLATRPLQSPGVQAVLLLGFLVLEEVEPIDLVRVLLAMYLSD